MRVVIGEWLQEGVRMMDDGFYMAGSFLMGFAVAAIVAAVICADHSVKDEAIERGYAQHCPLNGEWAWKGECE